MSRIIMQIHVATCVESWCRDCGPLELEGPVNGVKQTLTSIPVIQQANCSDTVVVNCQATLTNNTATFSDYRSRARLLITADSQICEFHSENGSHENLGDGCSGISYTIYKMIDSANRTMNFSYHIDKISRLHKSVVSCGVEYHPLSSTCETSCFAESESDTALIILQEEDECRTTEPPTNSTTELPSEFTTEPPTNSTTELPSEFTTEPPTNSTTELTTDSAATTPPTVDERRLPDVPGETVVYIVTSLSLAVVVLLLLNMIQCCLRVKRRNKYTDSDMCSRCKNGTLEKSMAIQNDGARSP